MKRALLTGITVQDGLYLAEFLLGKGYEVHGIIRRVAFEDPAHRLYRINHILKRITLHTASMESYPSLFNVIESTPIIVEKLTEAKDALMEMVKESD